jgi:hypothetical protein
MRVIWRLMLALLLAAPMGGVAGEIITVDDDGPADFNNIQAAINYAGTGDTVEVKPGTYTGPGNRDIDFLGKAITVRSTDPNDPNIVAATIVDCNGTIWDPHFGFTFQNNEDPNSVISGFTITNGYYEYGWAIHCSYSKPTIRNCIIYGNDLFYGSGIYCHNSNPTILECTIIDNHAFGYGGGIHNNASSNPMVVSCTFIGNRGDQGAGICNTDGSCPTIIGCVFYRNRARTGAGICNADGSCPTLIDCTFAENRGTYGAGVYNEYESSPTITNCSFSKNRASKGGGVCNFVSSDPVLVDCNFAENSASRHGGAMRNVGCSPILRNCTFKNNSAQFTGGAIYNVRSSPTFDQCAFNRNMAGNGGGMYNELSSPHVTNCIFTGNHTRHRGGGMLSIDRSHPIVVDCTFEENIAESDGAAIQSYHSYLTLKNCIIKGNIADDDGGGISSYDTVLEIVGCTFFQNVATKGNGGVIYNHGSVHGELTNCILSENAAGGNGGGIFSSLSTVELASCTLVGNSADVRGGGIMNEPMGNSWLTNCILWGNSAEQIYGPASVAYSDVQGGWLGGEGNIDEDPCFVDAGYSGASSVWVERDYRLLPWSRCVDAGDNNSLPADTYDLDGDGNTVEPIPWDLDSNPRIVDGDNDGNSVVDMGAYEANYVEAPMKFTPQTLNPGSGGRWVKVHFVLPEAFGVEDVDANRPAVISPVGVSSDWINVFVNEEELVEVEAAFGRAAFCAEVPAERTLDVTGILCGTSGQSFYGTDTVKITNHVFEYLSGLASYWLEESCGQPDWCGGADLDEDSVVDFTDFVQFEGCCIEVVAE